MIQLCGFAISNYYNKAKIALIEKGIAFEEVLVRTPITDPVQLAHSPMGKVPTSSRRRVQFQRAKRFWNTLNRCTPARLWCQQMRLRPPKCANCACTWICTWSWWAASCTA